METGRRPQKGENEMKFEITGKAVVVMGVYEGTTANEAFRRMCDDAGATYGDETTGTEADWDVIEVNA